MHWQEVELKIEYPETLAIESANICNAKCVFCPIYTGTDSVDRTLRKAKCMDHNLFVSVVDQIAAWEKKPRLIYLNLAGEPLLDKGLISKLEYLKAKGISDLVGFLTNAQFLTEDVSRKICEARIKVIRPALDSHIPEVYEKIRAGCNYETVLNNIINFAKIRNEMDSPIKIQIQHIRTSYNRNDSTGLYHLLKEYMREGDELFMGTAHSCSSSDLAKAEHILRKPEDHRCEKICPDVERNMYICADGIATACCFDYNLSVTEELCPGDGLGNANTTPVLDIWNGERRKKLKKILASEDIEQLPKYCRNCISIFGDFLKEVDEIPEGIPGRVSPWRLYASILR